MKNSTNNQNATLLHNVTYEEYYSNQELLQNQIKDLKQNFQPKEPDEYLTRDQVKQMLKCDQSTVHNWTKKGKLIAYGIGNRVYYKLSEVLAAIKPLNEKKGANNE